MASIEQPWVMGLWKFRDRVTPEQLCAFAEQLAEDSRYTQLYVRKVSKDQHGIGFTYLLPEEEANEEGHNAYFERTSDILKRTFGNDLVGWDMANPVWIVK
jgi:hypothetical protein